MTLQAMYPALVNSPFTELAQAIDHEQTTIEVLDGSKLPDAPNIATIGMGEDAETILYAQKDGNILNGITRGFQATPKSWEQGTSVARMFTAYDYDTLRINLQNTKQELDDTKEELGEHSAEKASKTELGHVQIGDDINVDDGVISVDKEGVRTDSTKPFRTEVVSSLPLNPQDGRHVLLSQDDGDYKAGTYYALNGEWL